jgi:hypothetical protein
MSEYPLQPHAFKLPCEVRVPSGDTVTIDMAATDTVGTFVHRVVVAANMCADDEDQYCLKARGFNDFMVGHGRLFAFAYVRKTVRNDEKLRLELTLKSGVVTVDDESEVGSINTCSRFCPSLTCLFFATIHSLFISSLC